MIYFNVNLRNPFWADRFQSIKTWFGHTPWKNKYWEIQLMKDCELFRIEFSWTIREDHAGVRLELGFAGYKVSFTFYDNRHWDYDTDAWVQIKE